MPKFYGLLDLNNNILTGVATASVGTNTTQAASTAFVQNTMQAAVVDLIMTTVPVTSTATTAATATLIDATNFRWSSLLVPIRRSYFLEIIGSATAGSPTVILTALGSTVAVVTLAGTASTSNVLTRSAVSGGLTNGTEYQIRLFNSVAGTASLSVARLIIL